MTEAEWLAATDPGEMVDFLNNRDASSRKFRLFSCACCRRIWHLLNFPEARQAVVLAEMFADGLATEADLEDAGSVLRNRMPGTAALNTQANARAVEAALKATWHCGGKEGNSEGAGYVVLCIPDAVVYEQLGGWTQDGESVAQDAEHHLCRLIRDIFGNPFRPVTVDLSWLTSTVVALAEGIYQDRAFDRMPILADALMDAGCDNEDVLNHCRSDGVHVRGCWVVDLLTGRK